MEVKGLWWAPGHRPRSSSRSKSRPRSGDPLIFSCPGLLFCPWLQTFWRSCTSIIKDTQNSNLEGSQWPNPRAIEGLMPCAVGKPFFWNQAALLPARLVAFWVPGISSCSRAQETVPLLWTGIKKFFFPQMVSFQIAQEPQKKVWKTKFSQKHNLFVSFRG